MERYACFFLSLHFVFFLVHGDDLSTMLALSKTLPPSTSNGNHWNNTTTNSNPCSWKGVNCSSSNPLHVTSLSLSGFGLTTSASNSSSALAFFKLLCEFESLEALDLSANSFAFIPSASFFSNCSGLSKLQALNLSSNELNVSLDEFSSFQSLEMLDLSNNLLQGKVRSKLGGLGRLRILNLGFNSIEGATIPLNENLEQLRLSNNKFTGNIPDDIVKLKNLAILDLSMNNFSGPIPDEIGRLSKLKELVLSLNKLSGPIPSGLSSITTLSRFAANQNRFNGAVPEGITNYLTSLDLSFNLLNGQIPSNLLSPPNLAFVDLSSNQLVGPLPGNFSRRLYRLRLGDNKLNGNIPFLSLPLPKLTYLELNDNALDGEIPVQLGNCQDLTLLDLSSNWLHGGLPKEMGNLHKLVILKLHENNLSGEILPELSILGNLITLNLSRNSFTGLIPSSIANLSKLVNLDLSGNRLYGPIPRDINQLSSLIELELGSNELNGTVPRLMPVSLTSALNLSNNHLSGSIPSQLAILNQLEILDLSNNNFTGEIPYSLTQMSSLTVLVLSDNQLSGILPSFKSFVNVTATGNRGLIIARPASGPGSPHTKKKSSTLIIIVSLVSAFIGVLLVSAVVFLLVSKRFYQVEDEGFPLEVSPLQIVSGHYITSDSIHRSNIDFAKTMEVVASPSNIMSKTRFSTYYKVVMPSGMSYSVKKLNLSEKISQKGSNDKFRQALQVLGRLSSSNVMVPLACVLTKESAYLFYEHVYEGTIYDFLHKDSGNVLDWKSRYSIALGVAQGLTFLHGCNQPVILLDLSTRSIHLKSMKEPQIGDIELCKVIDPSKSTGSLSTVAGSVGYIPPEYAYTMRVTAAGNVYSFGVILLELVTGKPPVGEGIELAKWALSFSAQVDRGGQILDPRVCNASTSVRSQMLSVLKVALSCVSPSPESRPKMRNALRLLFHAK